MADIFPEESKLYFSKQFCQIAVCKAVLAVARARYCAKNLPLLYSDHVLHLFVFVTLFSFILLFILLSFLFYNKAV